VKKSYFRLRLARALQLPFPSLLRGCGRRLERRIGCLRLGVGCLRGDIIIFSIRFYDLWTPISNHGTTGRTENGPFHERVHSLSGTFHRYDCNSPRIARREFRASPSKVFPAARVNTSSGMTANRDYGTRSVAWAWAVVCPSRWTRAQNTVLYKLLMCALYRLVSVRCRRSRDQVQTVCLPPREVITDFTFARIEDYPPIEGGWVLKRVIGKIRRPMENVGRCEQGRQSRDNLCLTTIV
jgi:hypothetical protein